MASTLAKIVRKAKQIRKSSPNKYKGKKAWQSYVKDAAKQVKKPAAKKRKISKVPAKRKPVRKAASKARPRTRRKKAVRKVTVTRSVSVMGSRKKSTGIKHRRKRKVGKIGGISPGLLIVGGLGLLAIFMLTKKQEPQIPPGAPPLVTTTNPVRDQKANNIVTWAVAGGLAIDAIIKLINSLNQSDDNEVDEVYDSINSGSGIPPYLIA